jgi:hypothetical protein
MTVSYSYDKPKVLQALRYHFINKKDIRLLLIAVNVLALLSGILFFLKKIEPTVFLLSSFLWVTLMIVFWFLMPRLIYSRTKAFKDSFIATINNEGVTLQQDQGSRVWQYTQFQSWFESPYCFHLYTAANAFFIIPKDPFTMEQLQEVRNIFKQNIAK